MRRRPVFTTAAAVLLLLAGAFLAARPEAPAQRSTNARVPARVRIAVVREVDGTHEVSFPGVTQAVRRSQLAFAVPGRLARRPVDVGARVRAGQSLAALEDREFRLAASAASASLQEAETRLAQMRRDSVRVRQLFEHQAATREEWEQTQTSTSALRAARDAAEAADQNAGRLLAESELRAPYAGTVTAVHLEPGEWTQPGRPIIELAGDGGFEIEVGIPETMRRAIGPGSEAQVRFPLSGREVKGRVRTVSADAPGPGRLFAVTVGLDPDPDLAAGLAAEVLLRIEGSPRAAVPLASVLNPGAGRPEIFRLRHGRAEAVPVELGELRGSDVLLRAGPAPGDSVVVAGQGTLVDGDTVEVE